MFAILVTERFADPFVSLLPDAFRMRGPVHLRSAITGKIGSPVTIRQPQFILLSEGSVAGADPVLVLSYAYWKSRFNCDPGVIGQKASVNGVAVTIVGVAPEGFHGLTSLGDSQGYLPLGMGSVVKDFPRDFLVARENAQFVAVIARLKAGVSLQQAQVALNVVARRLSRQYPTADRGMTLGVIHLGPLGLVTDPANVGWFSLVSALFLILAASVLVLACMNIANLFLVRAATRQREMALRAALGAGRTRMSFTGNCLQTS